MSEMSGSAQADSPTPSPVQIDGYKTLLFTWPPLWAFANDCRQTGVFTGYSERRDEYVTWLVFDGFVPTADKPVPDDTRWVGEEGLRSNSLTFAVGHHERYLRRVAEHYFKEM